MKTEEQNKRPQEIAQGTYDTIKELVEALRTANNGGDGDKIDGAYDALYEHPLSVEVRSGWCSVSAPLERDEYRILISWGGPAVQVTGKLDEYNQPATASLQSQDWFVEWRDWVSSEEGSDALLLEYASVFYYGE